MTTSIRQPRGSVKGSAGGRAKRNWACVGLCFGRQLIRRVREGEGGWECGAWWRRVLDRTNTDRRVRPAGPQRWVADPIRHAARRRTASCVETADVRPQPWYMRYVWDKRSHTQRHSQGVTGRAGRCPGLAGSLTRDPGLARPRSRRPSHTAAYFVGTSCWRVNRSLLGFFSSAPLQYPRP